MAIFTRQNADGSSKHQQLEKKPHGTTEIQYKQKWYWVQRANNVHNIMNRKMDTWATYILY